MSLNLNSTFKISFGKTSSLEFTNMKDAAYENLQFGQIAFKIAKQSALKVLDLKDDLFIITVISEDGTESMLYTGKWRSSTDYQAIIQNENAEISLAQEAETNSKLIQSLTEQVSNLQAEVTKWRRAAGAKNIKVGTVTVEPQAAINAISAIPIKSRADANSSTNTTIAISKIKNATANPKSTLVKGKLGGTFGDPSL
jgi:hypothetical protein